MSDYTPIACALHDEFEIAVMRAQPVRVKLQQADGAVTVTVMPLDIRVQAGEEFLVYRREGSEESEQVRLDRVRLLPADQAG